MGVYGRTEIKDKRTFANGSQTWLEIHDSGNGSIETRRVHAEAPSIVWETCFCCSCGEHGSDAHCRNHGFAGTRPCETHGTAGSPDDDDVMPESVQKAREKERA